MNLAKVPPIQQKRLVEFVNNFVISTVSFLDKFSNNCEISLQRVDTKLRKVEAELSILEAKLNSVPALKSSSTSVTASNPASTVLPNPASALSPNPPVNSPDLHSSSVSSTVEETVTSSVLPTEPQTPVSNPAEPKPVVSTPALSTPAVSTPAGGDPVEETDGKPKEVPEELKRFYKMIQFGVPVQAVKLKMKAEGFDPRLIDS